MTDIQHFIPLNYKEGRIMIDPVKEKFAGIELPEEVDSNQQTPKGKIVTMSQDLASTGELKKDDILYFRKYAPDKITVEAKECKNGKKKEKTYYFINAEDVLAKLNK